MRQTISEYNRHLIHGEVIYRKITLAIQITLYRVTLLTVKLGKVRGQNKLTL